MADIQAPLRAKSRGRLRVVIEAGLIPGEAGGIEQATEAMFAALGKLGDGDEEFIALTDARAPDWLDARLGPNSHVVPRPGATQARRRAVKEAVRRIPPLFRALKGARRLIRPSGLLEVHDPFVERLQPDVVHFPYQTFHRTSAPSLFNPWDLQHLHFPEFFPAEAVRERMALYPAWCARATAVEVAATQVKLDLTERLRVPEDKIYVVRRPSPIYLAAAPDAPALSGVSATYGIPDRFVYYPAQTWPHKNHLRLLRAFSSLRERGRIIHLVLSGRQNEFWPEVAAEIHRLGLEAQLHPLGFIPSDHVRALYHLATFTVFPTLFEGGGLPAVEALAEGCALACSDLPVLREQVHDAALYFDPRSVDSIASSLLRLDTDEAEREELARRGRAVAEALSWAKTARIYRALYRRLATAALDETDKALLREASGQSGPGAGIPQATADATRRHATGEERR